MFYVRPTRDPVDLNFSPREGYRACPSGSEWRPLVRGALRHKHPDTRLQRREEEVGGYRHQYAGCRGQARSLNLGLTLPTGGLG